MADKPLVEINRTCLSLLLRDNAACPGDQVWTMTMHIKYSCLQNMISKILGYALLQLRMKTSAQLNLHNNNIVSLPF